VRAAGALVALLAATSCVESRQVAALPGDCGEDVDRANDPAGLQDRAGAVPLVIEAGTQTLAVAPLQICPAGDVDMFAVSVTGKLTVSVELGETDGGELTASVLDDVTSQPMAGSGDLTWTGDVANAETRWVEIRGDAAAATGAYGLYLLLEDSDDDVDEGSDEDVDEGSDEDVDEGSDEDVDEGSDEESDEG
jgi:hypothetical protein